MIFEVKKKNFLINIILNYKNLEYFRVLKNFNY